MRTITISSWAARRGASCVWLGALSLAGCNEAGVPSELAKSTEAIVGPHTISGLVSTSKGPAAGITVKLTGSDSRTAFSDASGHYSIPGLGNAAYALSATASATCASTTVNVNQLTGDATINLGMTGTGCTTLVFVPGPTGPTGPIGPIGATGPVGATGAIGATGSTGAVGLVGPTGPLGPVGPIGPAGPIGLGGPAGPPGAPGAPGPAGAPGPVGPKGAAGPAGTTDQIGGTVFSTSGLTVTDSTPFTPLPGLDQTVDVPADSFVYLAADGGFACAGGCTDTTFSSAEVALLIDGLLPAGGGFRRVAAIGTPFPTNWSMAVTVGLSPGTHSVSVVGRGFSGTTGVIGGDSSSVLQAAFTIMVFKQ
jgi:hypothetical protein